MKFSRNLIMALFITLLAVSSGMAVELTDNKAIVATNSGADSYYFWGPYVISSIDRNSDGSLFVTFTDYTTLTVSYPRNQSIVSTALATDSDLYLYVSSSNIVYGILLFAY